LNIDHLPVDLHFRYRLRLSLVPSMQFSQLQCMYNVFFFNLLIDLLLIVAEVTSTCNETYVLILVLVLEMLVLVLVVLVHVLILEF